MIVAALCTQMLADCAGRPSAPEAVALAPIKSAPVPRPLHAQLQSASGRDCQSKPSGLGDTWIDVDEIAAGNCPMGRRTAGAPKSSTK